MIRLFPERRLRRLGRILSTAAFALLAFPVAARPPMWVAHGAHATVYLFGSVHLLPAGLDWRPPALLDALSGAGEVWFELPIDEATNLEAARLAQARGLYPKGETLFAHLTAAQSALVARAAKSLGVAPEGLEPMRPWLADVTLDLAADESAGAAAGEGVEQQVQALAPSTARRRAFETAAEQIGFLADAQGADQIASLESTARQIEQTPKLYATVVAQWMAGDVAGLQVDALAPLEQGSPGLYARLITGRNRRWAQVIERRLAGKGVAVVVVGVGHLIGPGGVPALLRAAGVAVEGP